MHVAVGASGTLLSIASRQNPCLTHLAMTSCWPFRFPSFETGLHLCKTSILSLVVKETIKLFPLVYSIFCSFAHSHLFSLQWSCTDSGVCADSNRAFLSCIWLWLLPTSACEMWPIPIVEQRGFRPYYVASCGGNCWSCWRARSWRARLGFLVFIVRWRLRFLWSACVRLTFGRCDQIRWRLGNSAALRHYQCLSNRSYHHRLHLRKALLQKINALRRSHVPDVF